MNRLDRFLLSEDQRISTWQISAQWVGARDISDHCPTCLACLVVDWGPKPFRFNNYLLEHEDLIHLWRKVAEILMWEDGNYVCS